MFGHCRRTYQRLKFEGLRLRGRLLRSVTNPQGQIQDRIRGFKSMSTTNLSKPPHRILKPKLTMLGYALCATVCTISSGEMEVATLGSRGREAGERYVRDVMPPYGVWAYQSDPGNIPSRRSAVLGRIERALSNLKKGPQFGNLLRRFGW